MIHRFSSAFLSVAVSPLSIQTSPFVVGTTNLITDLSKWLLVLAPAVTVALVIYFFIRKGAADEMDAKKWNNRITVAVISCIGAVIASVMLQTVLSYY